MQTYSYRWGILAPGKIARKFASGMRALPGDLLHGVASRNKERALEFAHDYHIPHVFDSYEALAAHPEIDIIYVASPHNFHHEQTLMCLRHGKHVLVEKPLAINTHQATEMIQLAKAQNLFLQEAMWTRFLPVMRMVRTWLADQVVGPIHTLHADFNFRSATWDLDDRKFNPDLAGGALLDVGIYPIALAYMVFGEEPVEVHASAHLGETGVDYQSAYLFRYAGGQLATLSSGFEAHGPKEAVISGTKGHIRIPLFWRGNEAVITLHGEAPQQYVFPYDSSGLQFQAEQMMADLDAGMRESNIMPHRDTLAIHQMMDRIRSDWGMKYPDE